LLDVKTLSKRGPSSAIDFFGQFLRRRTATWRRGLWRRRSGLLARDFLLALHRCIHPTDRERARAQQRTNMGKKRHSSRPEAHKQALGEQIEDPETYGVRASS
jgi:hypothetical protein